MEKVLKKYKHNHLLQHDDIGKPKPTTRYLPPVAHAYGKSEKKDEEGASISKLVIHFQSPSPGPSTDRARRRQEIKTLLS